MIRRILIAGAATLALLAGAHAAGFLFLAGPGSPPVCSNSLDFSAACNSQYIGIF